MRNTQIRKTETRKTEIRKTEIRKTKKVTAFILLLAFVLLTAVGCAKKETGTAAVQEQKEDSTAQEQTEGNTAQVTEAAKTPASDTQATATPEASKAVSVPTGHKADSVKIGFVDVTGKGVISDTLGVARDKGFLDEEFNAIGVKVELLPMTGAGPAINEALASKNLDIGFLGDVPAIIGKAAGIDTRLISFNGLSSGASLVVNKNSSFTSVADLKGKKIATQKGAFMHKVLIDILTANHLTINDIEFVNLNAQGAAEAFIAGNVDGVVVGGSTLTNLVEGGYGDVLVDYREHPEWNCGGYGIARTKFIEENPDIIKALLRALVKAQKAAIEDKDVMLQQWESTGLSASAYEYLYPNHDNYFNIKKSEQTVEAGKATVQFLLDNQLITEQFDFEGWINSSFYEVAYSELGE